MEWHGELTMACYCGVKRVKCAQTHARGNFVDLGYQDVPSSCIILQCDRLVMPHFEICLAITRAPHIFSKPVSRTLTWGKSRFFHHAIQAKPFWATNRPSQWVVQMSDWSSCSATCMAGSNAPTMTREVTCVNYTSGSSPAVVRIHHSQRWSINSVLQVAVASTGRSQPVRAQNAYSTDCSNIAILKQTGNCTLPLLTS